MTTTAAGTQLLRYFIHDDFDAFRMEISGGLVGSAARAAYEAWRVALLLARRARLVVDISFVTQADEYGEAVLQAWQEQEVQIVASSPASLAIANSIAPAQVHLAPRRTLVDRLRSLFGRRLPAGNSAIAEGPTGASAGPKQENVENTGFGLLSRMEHQVR